MDAEDQDLYPSYGDQGEGSGEDAAPETDREDAGRETFTVPKQVMEGRDLKPGDTVSFRVTHIFDEELELTPISDAQEEQEEEQPEARPSANDEIDQMAGMPMSED